jgi:hypothetical protein
MAPSFGHDFGRVRIHADPTAARSAEAVHARAYTVGDHIVFGAGEYNPTSQAGTRLIAHELTHVVQQRSGSVTSLSAAAAEGEAEHEAQTVPQNLPGVAGRAFRPGGRPPTGTDLRSGRERLQRQAKPGGKDATAQKIIDAAKDATKTPDAATRAKNAVWDILKAYYAGEASKVSDVVWVEDEPGLRTYQVGTGSNTTGKVEVGRYFLEHIDSFARRVLQVGHELQHVDQYRTGKVGGPAKSDEREFLAFEWEARQQPKAGTGVLADSLRRDLIDCALGAYNCLNEESRKGYAEKKSGLETLRATVNGTMGNPKTEPPAGCKRCSPSKAKSTGTKTGALEGEGGGDLVGAVTEGGELEGREEAAV